MCFCLIFIYTLIYIGDSFTWDSLPTGLQLMPRETYEHTCFLQKAHHTLCELRNARHHFSPTLGGCFKWWNHHEKITKNGENMAQNRLWKRHLFTVWELKQEGKVSPCLSSAGNVCIGWPKFLLALHTSINDHKNTVSIDFGITSKF